MHQSAKLSTSTVHCREKRSPLIADQNVVLNSDNLFTHHEVVFIMHHGERYSLRRTRNDKLILTK
jgi:hemin uptake protein HemP